MFISANLIFKHFNQIRFAFAQEPMNKLSDISKKMSSAKGSRPRRILIQPAEESSLQESPRRSSRIKVVLKLKLIEKKD